MSDDVDIQSELSVGTILDSVRIIIFDLALHCRSWDILIRYRILNIWRKIILPSYHIGVVPDETPGYYMG
jgi:hypothetical protein